MTPEFLTDGPALVLEGKMRVLIAADTHFGAETGFAGHGVHIQSSSHKRAERLLRCIDTAEPDLLILLGDVKHSIPQTTRQEFRELPEILSALREKVPIKVVPGNHDVGIERFLDTDELLPKEGAVIDGVGYIHGHTKPSPELLGRLIVVGHYHPVVHLYDEVGCALRGEPAYVICRTEIPDATRLLFMPAFFELAGGLDVRRLKTTRPGPVSSQIEEAGAEVFLSDGTYINTLEALTEEQP